MTKPAYLATLVTFGFALCVTAYVSGAAHANESKIEPPNARAELNSTPRTVPANTSARSYVVEDGDTLSEIAKTFLGDESKWMVIARANGIADPSRLEVGTRLEIPAASPQPTSREATTPASSRRNQ